MTFALFSLSFSGCWVLRTFSVATTSVFEAEKSLLKISLVLLTCSFFGLLAVDNEGDLELLSVSSRGGSGGAEVGSPQSSGGGGAGGISGTKSS